MRTGVVMDPIAGINIMQGFHVRHDAGGTARVVMS